MRNKKKKFKCDLKDQSMIKIKRKNSTCLCRLANSKFW